MVRRSRINKIEQALQEHGHKVERASRHLRVTRYGHFTRKEINAIFEITDRYNAHTDFAGTILIYRRGAQR